MVRCWKRNWHSSIEGPSASPPHSPKCTGRGCKTSTHQTNQCQTPQSFADAFTFLLAPSAPLTLPHRRGWNLKPNGSRGLWLVWKVLSVSQMGHFQPSMCLKQWGFWTEFWIRQRWDLCFWWCSWFSYHLHRQEGWVRLTSLLQGSEGLKTPSYKTF